MKQALIPAMLLAVATLSTVTFAQESTTGDGAKSTDDSPNETNEMMDTTPVPSMATDDVDAPDVDETDDAGVVSGTGSNDDVGSSGAAVEADRSGATGTTGTTEPTATTDGLSATPMTASPTTTVDDEGRAESRGFDLGWLGLLGLGGLGGLVRRRSEADSRYPVGATPARA